MSPKENKALIRGLIEEVWNKHNAAAVPDYIAPEQLEESMEHTIQFLTAFPDVRTTIEDLIAEGDRVVARLSVSGTHNGPFADTPPTGKRVTFGSIRVFRIANGKVAETWAMQDRLGLMQQLGVVAPTEGVNWAAGPSSSSARRGRAGA